MAGLEQTARDYVVKRAHGSAPVRNDRATAQSSTVSLVIPTLNEAANIEWVLQRVPQSVGEIVIVDGHSFDGTVEAVLASRPDARILAAERRGKGSALRTGFAAATGDIIVMIDGDGSMSPAEIDRYLHFLSDGYDLVKGSRFVMGGDSLDISLPRRMGNRCFVSLTKLLYDVVMTDLCYGFCAFHRRHLDALALTADGFEIETQITLHALRAGLRVAEVPSIELPRRQGASNLRAFRDGRRVLRTLVGNHPVLGRHRSQRHRRREPFAVAQQEGRL